MFTPFNNLKQDHMPNLSKEECLIIGKIFLPKTSDKDFEIIKKSIIEVKGCKGIYREVIKHGANLFELKNSLVELTGINQSSASELARILWRIATSAIEREKRIKIGIVYGIWIYEDYLCQHPSHASFNGKKFTIKSGVKVGIFTRIHAGQLVGCNCLIKPVMPF
ncbi:hypothetical protein CRN74_11640 [Yersinia frederiksenii]|nr:hypothetical protein CRN74_11640 [Yersinia frederiksenii]